MLRSGWAKDDLSGSLRKAQGSAADYMVFQDSSWLAPSGVTNVVFLNICTKFPFEKSTDTVV